MNGVEEGLQIFTVRIEMQLLSMLQYYDVIMVVSSSKL